MPLIRYDTGDVVLRQPSAACGWITATLGEVEGRRVDFIYDTQDRLLSPAVVSIQFSPFTGVRQIQFIQEAKGQYQIVLNGGGAEYRDETFIELAKGFLGEEAAVTVVHEDQIPFLASGKFQQVVSRYRPVR
jgi:phenylacetate-coenzyme A ligase PaaK-like adenylate-forming protein